MTRPLVNYKLDRYDNAYLEGYLDRYEDLVSDASEMAEEWDEMDEHERGLQRDALLPYWEKRTLLGALYGANHLSPSQIERLRQLDQRLVEQAAAVERAYGPTLRELLRYLSNSGTPLTKQPSILRIETTTTALIELANLVPA
ncbi:MAG: hypothetical protein ACPGWR_24355 [Ardenticatenaceae bacterium]